MRRPIYHAFKAANVEEGLAAEAAASIPDDVVSREEFLEAVNHSETKLDELKDAVAENKAVITEVAVRNEAAIAKSTEENKAAIAEVAAMNKMAIAKSTEENRVAIAEMATEIAKSTEENRAAIAEVTAKTEVAIATAIASLRVEMIRWMFAINATSAGIILGVLKLL